MPFSSSKTIMRVAYGQYLGARSRQEDYIAEPVYLSSGRGVLLVLADGMGGHDDGHRASRIVAESFTSAVVDGASLDQALEIARTKLAQQKENRDIAENAGCTLVAVQANERSYSFISVGDSYIIHKPGEGEEADKMHIVNDLHTLGWQLLQEGRIKPSEVDDKKYAPLVSAVTGKSHKHVSRATRKWVPGDRIVLASDGILTYGLPSIGKLLKNNVSAPGRKLTPLVETMLRAVERYHLTHQNRQDNTSVLILEHGMLGFRESATEGNLLIERGEASCPRSFKVIIRAVVASLILLMAVAGLLLWQGGDPNDSGTGKCAAIGPGQVKEPKDGVTVDLGGANGGRGGQGIACVHIPKEEGRDTVRGLQGVGQSGAEQSKAEPNSVKAEQNSDKPVQNSDKPVQNSDKPVQNSDKPVQNSDKPVQNSDKPVQNSDKPVQNSDKSVQNGANPVQNSANPVQNSANPEQNSDKPVQNSANPVQNSDKPVQNSDNQTKKVSGLIEKLRGLYEQAERDPSTNKHYKEQCEEIFALIQTHKPDLQYTFLSVPDRSTNYIMKVSGGNTVHMMEGYYSQLDEKYKKKTNTSK